MIIRTLKAVLLASIGGAVIAFAAPAFAAPAFAAGPAQSDETTVVEKIEKKIIHTDGTTEKAAEAAIAQCGPRKFESNVESKVDGKTRRTRILLCSKGGESAAEWAATLEKAVAKIEANDALSDEARTKIIAEMKAEISKVRAAN